MIVVATFLDKKTFCYIFIRHVGNTPEKMSTVLFWQFLAFLQSYHSCHEQNIITFIKTCSEIKHIIKIYLCKEYCCSVVGWSTCPILLP